LPLIVAVEYRPYITNSGGLRGGTRIRRDRHLRMIAVEQPLERRRRPRTDPPIDRINGNNFEWTWMIRNRVFRLTKHTKEVAKRSALVHALRHFRTMKCYDFRELLFICGIVRRARFSFASDLPKQPKPSSPNACRVGGRRQLRTNIQLHRKPYDCPRRQHRRSGQ